MNEILSDPLILKNNQAISFKIIIIDGVIRDSVYCVVHYYQTSSQVAVSMCAPFAYTPCLHPFAYNLFKYLKFFFLNEKD